MAYASIFLCSDFRLPLNVCSHRTEQIHVVAHRVRDGSPIMDCRIFVIGILLSHKSQPILTFQRFFMLRLLIIILYLNF